MEVNVHLCPITGVVLVTSKQNVSVISLVYLDKSSPQHQIIYLRASQIIKNYTLIFLLMSFIIYYSITNYSHYVIS